MSKVAIREGIGVGLEPDDHCVNFAQRADQWVMDVIVYEDGSYDKAKSHIDAMTPGY